MLPSSDMEGPLMAQKTVVTLEDDIDGGSADETVTFALDGISYEIDLNDANAAALRDALATYVAHGRRTSGRSSAAARAPRRSVAASSPASSGGARRGDNSAIREWARSAGHAVNE